MPLPTATQCNTLAQKGVVPSSPGFILIKSHPLGVTTSTCTLSDLDTWLLEAFDLMPGFRS